jgi:hypothetical protein
VVEDVVLVVEVVEEVVVVELDVVEVCQSSATIQAL